MENLDKTHTLRHIYANNFEGYFEYEGKKVLETLELTYLLNSYIPERISGTGEYPIKGLDQACDSSKNDLLIDFFN